MQSYGISSLGRFGCAAVICSSIVATSSAGSPAEGKTSDARGVELLERLERCWSSRQPDTFPVLPLGLAAEGFDYCWSYSSKDSNGQLDPFVLTRLAIFVKPCVPEARSGQLTKRLMRDVVFSKVQLAPRDAWMLRRSLKMCSTESDPAVLADSLEVDALDWTQLYPWQKAIVLDLESREWKESALAHRNWAIQFVTNPQSWRGQEAVHEILLVADAIGDGLAPDGPGIPSQDFIERLRGCAATDSTLQLHEIVSACEMLNELKLDRRSIASLIVVWASRACNDVKATYDSASVCGAAEYELFQRLIQVADPEELLEESSRYQEALVRSQLSRVVSLAYSAVGRESEFRAIIDNQVAGAVNGDDRAEMLLLRAWHEETSRAGTHPLAGKLMVERAITAAETEEMNHRCVEYLATRYAYAGDTEQGLSILNALALRASGPDRSSIEQLRDSMRHDAGLAIAIAADAARR